MIAPKQKVSEELLQQVKSLDVADVIGKKVRLKRSGNTWLGLCPLHNEKTPSFTVNPQKQIFKCFGCGEGGDAIHFYQKNEGLDFVGAVKQIAEDNGIYFDDTVSEGDAQTAEFFSNAISANMAFSALCHDQLITHQVASNHLTSRGFDLDVWREWNLGYCKKYSVSDLIKKLGFSEEILVGAGIIGIKDDQKFCRFNNRVIVPICNHSGKDIVGFAGRAMNDRAKAKYVNTPASSIYNKSALLFGYSRARKNAHEQDGWRLVEGQFDVISMHQRGYNNTVGACGTAFTKKHISQMTRIAHGINMVFDGDPAGVASAEKNISTVLRFGGWPYITSLPEGEDPNNYLFKNKHLPDPLLFSHYIMGKLPEGYDHTKAVWAIVKDLAKIGDLIFRETILIQVSRSLGVSEEAIRFGLNRYMN